MIFVLKVSSGAAPDEGLRAGSFAKFRASSFRVLAYVVIMIILPRHRAHASVCSLDAAPDEGLPRRSFAKFRASSFRVLACEERSRK